MPRGNIKLVTKITVTDHMRQNIQLVLSAGKQVTVAKRGKNCNVAKRGKSCNRCQARETSDWCQSPEYM